MTAIVLPDIDHSTLAQLRERMPSLKLSEIELPSMEHAGRDADRAIDRWLGRSRSTTWPWLVLGIALLAVVGTTLWFRTWSRQPAWVRGRTALADPHPADALKTSGMSDADDTYGTEGGRP